MNKSITFALQIIFLWLLAAKPWSALADPALIQHYGQLPSYRSFVLSPDGKHYAFIKRQNNQDLFVILNVASGELVGGFRAGEFKARAIYFVSNEHVILKTSNTQRLSNYWGKWEESGALAYSLKTQRLERLLVGTRNLHPAQTGLGQIVAVNPDKALAYMPAFTDNRGGEASYDLYQVKLSSGNGRIHARGNKGTEDWFVDASGKVLAREDYREKSGEHRIYSKLSGRWTLIYNHKTEIPEIGVQGISADGKQLLVVDGAGDRQAIFAMSLHDGALSGPLYSRDSADASLLLDINRQFQGVRYSGLKPQYEFPNPRENKLFAELNTLFASSSVNLVSANDSRSQLLVSVSGGDAALAYKLLDTRSMQLSDLALGYEEVRQPAAVRPYHYQARDGLAITAVLTQPAVNTEQKLPLIVMPHGGPRSYDHLEFHWMAQFFARLGYLVLQPNFRGSTGFGYSFREAGNGKWGKEMQDDLSDGVAALVAEGMVDPKRVCIVGASYGGYAALAGVAFTPDLYRCAIAIAGVSDVAEMFLSDRREYGRDHWVVNYWSEILGDANNNTEPLKAISPLNFANQFKAPVLLIHGNDDTVVPIDQSKSMARALKKSGKPVRLEVLKGEDHWLSDSETRMAALAKMADFLKQHNPL